LVCFCCVGFEHIHICSILEMHQCIQYHMYMFASHKLLFLYQPPHVDVNKSSVHMQYVTRLGQLKFYAKSDVGTRKQGFKGRRQTTSSLTKVHTKCNRTYSYIEMPCLTLCSQSSKLLFWNSHESHSYRSQPEQSESKQIPNYCGGVSSMFTDWPQSTAVL